jgi:hypothetical protein
MANYEKVERQQASLKSRVLVLRLELFKTLHVSYSLLKQALSLALETL